MTMEKNEIFLLRKDSRLFKTEGKSYYVRYVGNVPKSEYYCDLLIVGIAKDNGKISFSDPDVFDTILAPKKVLEKIDKTPQEIIDYFNYDITKYLSSKWFCGDSIGEIINRINHFVTNEISPKQFSHHGLMNFEDSYNFSFFNNLNQNPTSLSERNKNGVFFCHMCNKFHLIDNLQTSEQFITCKECAEKTTSCTRCGRPHLKSESINDRFKFAAFCSNACQRQFTPKVPRCGYNAYEKNEIEVADTTFNHISERSFGLELETAGLKTYKPYKHLLKHWKIVSDGSLRSNSGGTGEFVSSILRGDEGLRVINRLVDYFTVSNYKVNDSCGFHLHVGASDFDKNDLYNILKFVKLNEQLLLYMEHESRIHNNNISSANISLPSNIKEFDFDDLFLYVTEGKMRSLKVGDKMAKMENFKKSKKNGPRTRWFNICPLIAQGTIEIRIHAGTTKREEIINWTKLWVSIFDGIKDGSLKPEIYKDLASILESLNFKDDSKRTIIDFYLKRFRDKWHR